MTTKSNPLAGRVLEAIKDHLDEEEKRVIKKALTLMREEKLTGEKAQQLFYEIRALRGLPAKLKKQTAAAARSLDKKPVDHL